MRFLFWLGVFVGWLTFLPLVIAATSTIDQVVRWIDEPFVGFGRKGALYAFRRDGYTEERLATMAEWGVESRHLWRRWYWLRRKGA